jgi:hypothetical protein
MMFFIFVTHKDVYKCINNDTSSVSLFEFYIICYLFQHIKSLKYAKPVLMIFSIGLYSLNAILKLYHNFFHFESHLAIYMIRILLDKLGMSMGKKKISLTYRVRLQVKLFCTLLYPLTTQILCSFISTQKITNIYI